MDNEEKKKYKQYLSFIQRTRLLCNTTKELGDLVDYNLNSGNGLSRMGGESLFLKKAIFSQLANIVSKQCDGLNLEEVVEAYFEADNFLDNYSSQIKKSDVVGNLIDYFYLGTPLPKGCELFRGKISRKHVPLLILLFSKAMPRIKEKGGDVTDIRQTYEQTLDLISNSLHFKDIPPMETLPSMEMMKDIIRNHPEKMCRIHLISMVNYILTEFQGLCSHENMVERGTNIYTQLADLNIKGIWTARDTTSPFWLFEKIHNGYNFYECIPDSANKILHTTKYFAQFFDNGSLREAVIIHPEAVKYIYENQPVPNHLFSYFIYNIRDEGNCIEFTPQSDRLSHVNLKKLYKRPKEERDYFLNFINNYTEQEAFPDYKFQICLSAITEDYLYVKNLNGGYYKIPVTLDKCLKLVQMTDSVGITQNEGKTYLAFGDQYNLIYDISTPDKLKALGITVVDHISG